MAFLSQGVKLTDNIRPLYDYTNMQQLLLWISILYRMRKNFEYIKFYRFLIINLEISCVINFVLLYFVHNCQFLEIFYLEILQVDLVTIFTLLCKL